MKAFYLLASMEMFVSSLDPLSYDNERELDAGMEYRMFWKADQMHLYLGFQARTASWIGLGFADVANGGMLGADIVTAYFDDAKGTAVVQDNFAVGDSLEADECQDWQVLASSHEQGIFYVEIKRLLNTADTQDRALKIVSGQPSRVIAAWGDAAAAPQVGTTLGVNRYELEVLWGGGSRDVLALLRTSGEEEFPLYSSYTISQEGGSFKTSFELTDVFDLGCVDQSPDLLSALSNGAVEDCDTLIFDLDATFGNGCEVSRSIIYDDAPENATFADVCPVTCGLCAKPEAKTYHLVGLELMLRDETKGNVVSVEVQTFDTSLDFVTLWRWAPGAEPFFVAPPECGFRIEMSTDGVVGVTLKIQYREAASSFYDDTGVRLFATRIGMRAFDCGMLALGDPKRVLAESLPQGSSSHTFECPADCMTRLFADRTVFVAQAMQSGGAGTVAVRTSVESSQGGEAQSIGLAEFFLAERSQFFAPAGGPLKLQGGDRLLMTCNIDTADGASVWGQKPNEAWCSSHLLYYPKQPAATVCGFGGYCGKGPASLVPSNDTSALATALWNKLQEVPSQRLGDFGDSGSICGVITTAAPSEPPTPIPTLTPTTAAPTFSPSEPPTIYFRRFTNAGSQPLGGVQHITVYLALSAAAMLAQLIG